MAQTQETRKFKPQYRFLTLPKEAVNAEARTVELAFSSEQPYERFFGTEILDHAPDSVRLGRLQDGGALLLDHDPSRHIGVVEQVAIGDDRVGRAVVRFSRNAEAEAVFKDVQDGIRKHVSVGYMLHRMELISKEGEQETFRVSDWEPFEISLVAIPADPTVGVGRSSELSDVSVTVVRQIAEPQPEVQPQIVKAQIMNEIKEKTPAELERERSSAIIGLGEQYKAYVQDKDVADAIRNGRSVEQFKDLVMDKMQTRHTDTSVMHIGMDKKEVQRYSLARAILASVTGNWAQAGLERDASEAVAKMIGKSPEGFYVPYDAFRRDFNMGTATEAGNLRATDLRTDLYVDALRNAMVLGRMNVRILSGLQGNIAIPRKATASTLGMLAEIGSASESNPTVQQVSLSPKRVGAYIEVSKQAIIQSSMALEPMLRDDLLMGAGVLIESQVLNGVGSSNEMTGLRNTSGIGTVVAGANGAALVWDHLVDLESACANSNAEPDVFAGYITNTKVRGKAKKVTKSTYLPWIWQDGAAPLNGYRAAITNNVPSNLTKGTSTTICSAALFSSDWSMAVIGLFGAPDITVDPYSKADTGQVKITLNQFADCGFRQPAAFAKIEDILTT